jgi:capsular exopolysaccharide synthesis family protein
MSKIYEALKKAEREKVASEKKAVTKRADEPQASTVQPGPPSKVDLRLPPVVAEEYRKMLNALNLKHAGAKVKTLLMTSSVHGEGTSSVCSQFARSLTQEGREKVLLVDSNLRNPILHNIFGLRREAGFVELMEGNASAEELIKETKIPGISVLTSGRASADPSPLLSSPRLKEVLTHWSRRYSYVLFDSSPVLAYADALILSRVIDGVVLVVQAGKTRWEIIRRAQDTLSNVKAPLLGVVLNRRQFVIPKGVYKRL